MEIAMQIDFKATRHNMRMIRLSVYAEERGIAEPTLRRILADNYGPHRGEKYQAVIDTLRRDGFLVEVPGSHDSSMAA